MKKANSKRLELDWRGIKSTLVYMLITWATFYTANTEFVNWILNNLNCNPDLVAWIITWIWILSKKILTDYSK